MEEDSCRGGAFAFPSGMGPRAVVQRLQHQPLALDVERTQSSLRLQTLQPRPRSHGCNCKRCSLGCNGQRCSLDWHGAKFWGGRRLGCNSQHCSLDWHGARFWGGRRLGCNGQRRLLLGAQAQEKELEQDYAGQQEAGWLRRLLELCLRQVNDIAVAAAPAPVALHVRRPLRQRRAIPTSTAKPAASSLVELPLPA